MSSDLRVGLCCAGPLLGERPPSIGTSLGLRTFHPNSFVLSVNIRRCFFSSKGRKGSAFNEEVKSEDGIMKRGAGNKAAAGTVQDDQNGGSGREGGSGKIVQSQPERTQGLGAAGREVYPEWRVTELM